ncbi:hypothetical protein [Zhongshania aquimaris]|uniref:Tetratricopeptide repeat protein n=1 Tax=Zhongshania aquimaris TaxID=2857107 RepID=A0ABS6VQ81_9GAMM|nr:hypothetical protein [Zhongshania aquimaris]MBW2940193.1 hypothetical protein [Zhongshania aquimaris]
MAVPGKNRSFAWVMLVLVGVLVVIVYWPGMYGPFLFDDFGNLDKLGALGGVDNWATFNAFVFGGTSGPTGRPISLLSFLMNAQNWPADPFPFKLTNLAVHVLCGQLVYLICIQILNFLKIADGRSVMLISATTAGIWLLHPFLISTTLYVVQRMAQLAALFCFAGIAGYLYGRSLIFIKPMKAYFIMGISVGVGTVLAMFSKENGALLPMLVLVLEFTILANDTKHNTELNKIWKFLFLQLPSMLIAGYLIWRVVDGGLYRVISSRGFSIYERLLTEGRILLDYQSRWFFPRLYTGGVFQDDYLKSTGIFNPISTFWALAFHSVLLIFFFWIRKRWALLSFAGLFFYASHLIESTTVPLELYFEHRNYLGAAFLILPFIYLLYKYLSASLAIVMSLLIFLLLGTMTFNVAKIWSNYDSMVLSWASLSPNSSRAQQQASMQLYNSGNIDAAIRVTNEAIANNPKAFDLRVWELIVSCQVGRVGAINVAEAITLAKVTKYDLRTFEYYKFLVNTVHRHNCENLALSDTFSIVSALLENPVNANTRSARYAQIHYLLGVLSVYQGDVELGRQYFKNSLSARPSPDSAMYIAALLATEGYYKEALDYAELARSYISKGRLGASKRTSEDFKLEIDEFEKVVRKDLQQGE